MELGRLRRIIVASLLAGGMGILAPRVAQAGITSSKIDFLQVTPFFGSEYTHIAGASQMSNTLASPTTQDFSSTNFTLGGTIGLRLGPISFGLLVQRTSLEPQPQQSLAMNKLYGEFGINMQWEKVIFLIHFDGGYAFMGGDNMQTIQGFGGKLGLGVDYYPKPIVSIGAGGAFDGQGFVFDTGTDKGVKAAYGGTFCARIGLHL